MGENLGIKLNKILINRRGIRKVTKAMMTKDAKERRREKKRLEKKRLRKLHREQDRLLAQRSLEIRHMKKMFPDARFTHIRVARVPEEMKFKFIAWCGYRGYTASGRIRKFVMDCITGVIKE